MTGVRTCEHVEHDYALGRTYLSMGARQEGRGRRGTFWSGHGLVDVFTSDDPRWTVTHLVFVRDGRIHSRRWNAAWGDKTIARLARELVEDVVGR